VAEIGKRNTVSAVRSGAAAWNSISSTMIHIYFATEKCYRKSHNKMPGEGATWANEVLSEFHNFIDYINENSFQLSAGGCIKRM
jgi:hypothetical protein